MKLRPPIKHPAFWLFIAADIFVSFCPGDTVSSPVVILVAILFGIVQGFWACGYIATQVIEAMESETKMLNMNLEGAINRYEMEKLKYEQALAGHNEKGRR